MNRLAVLAAVSIAALSLAPIAAAQAAAGPPHTSWGAPDLQGFWTNASITKLTRPGNMKSLVMTSEEAKKLEDGDFNNQRTTAEFKPTDQRAGAPEKGRSLDGVGNYNAVWVDPGAKVAIVNGELRSSWITVPEDGKIPYKPSRGGGRVSEEGGESGPAPAATHAAAKPAPAAKPAAKAAAKPAAKPVAKPAVKAGAKKDEPAAFIDEVARPRRDNGELADEASRRKAQAVAAASRSYEGPESRSVGERCLVGFGTSGGPVLNNVLYNNTYQIVQSPNHVVLLTEMVHDARIIPIVSGADKAAAAHRPAAIKPWLGDSVGWYEGDTLVVETKNVNPIQRGYIGTNGKLVERFSRNADGTLLYKFEVEDPEQFTQVWKGEMPLRPAPGLYEYACHEGNYAMPGILGGARRLERQGGSLVLTAEDEG
ncbi:MAG TPA: hypothetical protein VGO52_15105 [Hyphomonadaceae bacterium]|jgi:hypothetical protein|nr:hypothetical protein [Hyphomonadaceae bacterium]